MANNDRAAVQSGLNDILGDVIKSDQKSAGRSPKLPAAKFPDTAEQPDAEDITLLHYDNNTLLQTNKHTNKQTGNGEINSLETDAPPAKKRSLKTEISDTKLKESLPIEQRRSEAAAMAKGTTMTVTLRIPEPMNAWLDSYVHLSWPNKIKKQELVIEALQMLYARRGRPGEKIVSSELLTENTKE